jgi:hypothetical protein
VFHTNEAANRRCFNYYPFYLMWNVPSSSAISSSLYIASGGFAVLAKHKLGELGAAYLINIASVYPKVQQLIASSLLYTERDLIIVRLFLPVRCNMSSKVISSPSGPHV